MSPSFITLVSSPKDTKRQKYKKKKTQKTLQEDSHLKVKGGVRRASPANSLQLW